MYYSKQSSIHGWWELGDIIKSGSPWYLKIKVSNVAYAFHILLSIYLTLHTCPYKFSTDDMWFPSVAGIPHIWWLQVSHECYWGPRLFYRRGSRLVWKNLGQALSIEGMINSKKIRTSLIQGRFWRWRVRRFMAGSSSGRSSWPSLNPTKTFLPNYRHIPLFLSTF